MSTKRSDNRSKMTLNLARRRLISFVNKDDISTWFDMNLALDRLKDNPTKELHPFSTTFKQFTKRIAKGVAFISFDYGVDGVTIETVKYANALEKLLGEKTSVHWITGQFFKESNSLIEDRWQKHEIPEIRGFGDWDGYHDYFHTKLKRGSKEYNVLATKLWKQTKEIAITLSHIIHDNEIHLLFPINICSNPGNVPLAFALALVSELMDIPVFNSSHDFYFESGKKAIDRKDDEAKGIRDHFFTNADIGEVFSIIETLYPWNGKKWYQTTINTLQENELITKYGFNPMGITPLSTCVELKKYKRVDPYEKKKILKKMHYLLSDGQESLITKDIKDNVRNVSSLTYDKNLVPSSPIILGYRAGIPVNLINENLLFVQPTRIIGRKRIEINFDLIYSLLNQEKFQKYFTDYNKLTITMYITGPIANGHIYYFYQLMDHFHRMLEGLPEDFRERIFLAFNFGHESHSCFKEKGLKDHQIHQTFSAATAIMLPSQTEGRGLPIIESCAAQVPIICSRYEPNEVYSELIGEHLEQAQRLKVFELPEGPIQNDFLEKLSSVLIDMQQYDETASHNRDVVKKRFSTTSLVKNFEEALYGLWKKCYDDTEVTENVRWAFKLHKKNTNYDELFHQLVLSENRQYLSGYTPVEFMIYLKSLIDPSFFRVEEMNLRGSIFKFAQEIVFHYEKGQKLTIEEKNYFYKHIEEMFNYYRGTDELAIDHSLSYRHRHRRHYPYRKLTKPELCGIVSLLFKKIIKTPFVPPLQEKYFGHFTNLRDAITELVGGPNQKLAIDDRDRLLDLLTSKCPIAYFPGRRFADEMKIFVLTTLKYRLHFSIDDELTKADLTPEKIKNIGPISIFVREFPLKSFKTYDGAMALIKKKSFKEIRLLLEVGLVKIVKTKFIASGVHLGQLGRDATKKLLAIKDQEGIAIAFGNKSLSLDMLDMPSFRLGTVDGRLAAIYMGLEVDESYIQWVPSGLKPSLAYPTPIQTPKEFSTALKSYYYLKAVEKLGQKKLLEVLREDADKFGTPVAQKLQEIINDKNTSNLVESNKLNGLHEDGLPWSGAMAKISMKEHKWKLVTAFADRNGNTVSELIKKYQNDNVDNNDKVQFAWNGGYILNGELVGKLGLPEDYIGSPLGLICSDGNIMSLPLYNKATFVVTQDGLPKIIRANLKNGFVLKSNDSCIEFTSKQRNLKRPTDQPIFYDLLYKEKSIPSKDRIILKFAGNKLIEKIQATTDTTDILPVGITISLPKDYPTQNLQEGAEFQFDIPEYSDMLQAIEAGPLLVKNSKLAIDMETEGWKTDFSIATQAARLDYTDMRGPKIAIGITKNQELIVVAINGRIRESVGATHIDLANILIKYGATDGMGFDPGGSTTLIVDNEQLNISPYNKDYEKNNYSLPPMARTVGNAILVMKG